MKNILSVRYEVNIDIKSNSFSTLKFNKLVNLNCGYFIGTVIYYNRGCTAGAVSVHSGCTNIIFFKCHESEFCAFLFNQDMKR